MWRRDVWIAFLFLVQVNCLCARELENETTFYCATHRDVFNSVNNTESKSGFRGFRWIELRYIRDRLFVERVLRIGNCYFGGLKNI